jgi:DNA-directed RNA polymerase specialized sigma24 family protein
MGPPGGNSADARSPDARSADAYQDLRPLMFAIAYRMLGSVSEAEDIVQEAFLRYHRALGQAPLAEAGEPDSPKAYLSAVTTRLCIDHVRSARARREAYVGEWLPEPLLTDPVGRRPGRAGRPGRASRLPVDGVPPAAGTAIAGGAGRVLAARHL